MLFTLIAITVKVTTDRIIVNCDQIACFHWQMIFSPFFMQEVQFATKAHWLCSRQNTFAALKEELLTIAKTTVHCYVDAIVVSTDSKTFFCE